MIFTVHQAKTQLSRLIAQALAGEEVVIARGAKPAVRLTPLEPAPRKSAFGALAGKITFSDAFFDPLPSEELAAWEDGAD